MRLTRHHVGEGKVGTVRPAAGCERERAQIGRLRVLMPAFEIARQPKPSEGFGAGGGVAQRLLEGVSRRAAMAEPEFEPADSDQARRRRPSQRDGAPHGLRRLGEPTRLLETDGEAFPHVGIVGRPHRLCPQHFKRGLTSRCCLLHRFCQPQPGRKRKRGVLLRLGRRTAGYGEGGQHHKA